jgi:hypothetical protein
MPTLSLDAIQQRIAQRDAELQSLRRELEARRSRLQALTQRKEELQAKLQKIEAEMAMVTVGAKRPQLGAPKAATKKPLPTPSAAGKRDQPSLPSLLVSVLRKAGRPLTAKHLVQAAKRRGIKSKSANFTQVVEARLGELKKRGVIHRAPDQPGYILAPSPNEPAPKAGPTHSAVAKPTPKAAAKPARSAGSAKGKPSAAAAAKPARPVPLRVVLQQILKRQKAPMTGSELAREALKAGYQTTSKQFVEAVWKALGSMDNVENVNGQGYRLKRSK